MTRFASALMIGVAISAGATPALAADDMAGGSESGMAAMKIMPDGEDMAWAPAPANLPKGMTWVKLAGDPAQSGPFTIRLTMPANTVIAPHTHSKDENVTVISGDFYHGHETTIDKSKGTEVHTGGFVFLPANHVHSLWTGNEPAVIQVTGTGPFGVQYINPADDPSKGHS